MASHSKRLDENMPLENIDTVVEGDDSYDSPWVWPSDPPPCDHQHRSCWKSYYPEKNPEKWEDKAKRSLKIDDKKDRRIYKFHILPEGCPDGEEIKPLEPKLWETLQKAGPYPRLAEVVCVENPSIPLLQVLGHKYEIDPTFFAPVYKLPLPFRVLDRKCLALNLRFPHRHTSKPETPIPVNPQEIPKPETLTLVNPREIAEREIDWLRAYFITKEGDQDSCTIICITSSRPLPRAIESRCNANKKTRSNNTDPLLVLFPFYWYAIRRWHMALEEINSNLEDLGKKLLDNMDLDIARSLHHIRARLLDYQPMLDEIEMAIDGISSRCNGKEELEGVRRMLLDAYKRLEKKRKLSIERVENVINFVFNHVTVRDSGVMRQISYLTMIFFPASFVASVFGMNIKEINPDTSLIGYLETAIPFTIITVWILVALQITHYFGTDRNLRPNLWTRLFWPRLLVRDLPFPPERLRLNIWSKLLVRDLPFSFGRYRGQEKQDSPV